MALNRRYGRLGSDGCCHRPEPAAGYSAAEASFVHPSYKYIDYIDFKVIAILFCLMAVIAGIRKLGAFEVLAQKMVKKTGSVRSMSLALILMSFFSSMFITNDVALITFVPFTIAVLSCVFTAANLIMLAALLAFALAWY